MILKHRVIDSSIVLQKVYDSFTFRKVDAAEAAIRAPRPTVFFIVVILENELGVVLNNIAVHRSFKISVPKCLVEYVHYFWYYVY